MTDLELIKLVHASLDDLKFSYIRDNEIYLKSSKNFRFNVSRVFTEDVTIRANGRTITTSNYQILMAGFASKEPFEIFSSDDGDYESHKWDDITSEEDFFQKSLVLDFKKMGYELFSLLMEIREKILIFVENDQETCYRVHKYKWNKRKKS